MTTTPLDALFGAQGGGDFLTEEGTFTFEATKAEAKPSSTGKPGLKVIAKVVSGGPSEGKTITHQMFASPESETALNILWRSLQALGISQDFAVQVTQNLPEGAVFNQLFLEAAKVIPGRRFVADVAKDKDNTREEFRDRIKVQWALKPATEAVAPPTVPAPVTPAPAAPAAPVAVPEPTPVPAPAPAVAPVAVPVAVPAGESPPF